MNMFNSITLLVIILLLIVLFFNKYFRSNIDDKLPYYKKNPLSIAELSLFKVLERVIGNQYYIFPQVNLSSLVKINARGRMWWTYFGKISRKSVDFVLAEKTDCRPILIIELDDSTHKNLRRHDRDIFCDKVFKSAQLPILHIIYGNEYNIVQLKEEIEAAINPVLNTESLIE